jgi:tRNA 2-selenouridine synthase
MNTIDIESYLQRPQKCPIIDVRSESEYEAGHIPGALNVALFNDEERHEIGKTFKSEGQKKAIKRGLEFVGPRMKSLIEEVEKIAENTVLIHCWRGGMRSRSISWLLDLYGIPNQVLDGGYKAYRRYLIEYFNQDLKLIILTGLTGSGKTEVLNAMSTMGEQVVDLEGLARHKGSSFGKQLAQGQPTNEQFQNQLFHEFFNLDKSRRIWLEDESFRIGRVNFIESLYLQKNRAPHVLIELPKQERVDFLCKHYGVIDQEHLIRATTEISKKLGRENTEAAIEAISNKDLNAAAATILTYYDKRYQKSIESKHAQIVNRFKFKKFDPNHIAKTILNESN